MNHRTPSPWWTTVIDPHREKYFELYWRVAFEALEESPSKKRQVGAVVVTPTGMISLGWNAMPSGFPNECEHTLVCPDTGESRLKANPETIHAERNAIDKMTNQGIPVSGSLLFVTTAPCFECAKALHGLGLKGVHYINAYKNADGIEFLERAGVPVFRHPHTSDE